MVPIGGIPYSDLGALQIINRPAEGIPFTSAFPRIGGWAVYEAIQCAFVEDAGAAVPTDAVNIGGWAYTSDGALYVTTDTTTGPFTWIGGFKTRQDGALCIITDTPDPTADPYVGGWAADGATAAAMVGGAGFGFILPLEDAGAGTVNITPLAGVGTGTFTRATTATTVDSAGLIVSVASGIPRSYYDPTSLEYLGYLTEGARTNLCLQSEDFSNAAWAKTNITVTANSVTSPYGASTADTITNTTAFDTATIGQDITVANDTTTYTRSCFFKAGTITSLNFRSAFTGGTAKAFAGAVNLSTGSIVVSEGSPTVSIKSYPNGWYRVTLTDSNNGLGNTNYASQIYPGIYDGVTLGDLYAWGAQFEIGSFASSYIPTAAVAVTRNADVLTYPTAGNVQASSGAVYAEVYQEGITNPGRAYGPYFTSTIDGATELGLRVGDSGSIYPILAWGDGASANSVQGTSFANDYLSHNMAATWGTIAAVAHDGILDGSVSMTNGIVLDANMYLGLNGDGNFPMFGTIKNVRISQAQLTDAQLQALTA